jgi:hypothetical protein
MRRQKREANSSLCGSHKTPLPLCDKFDAPFLELP